MIKKIDEQTRLEKSINGARKIFTFQQFMLGDGEVYTCVGNTVLPEDIVTSYFLYAHNTIYLIDIKTAYEILSLYVILKDDQAKHILLQFLVDTVMNA